MLLDRRRPPWMHVTISHCNILIRLPDYHRIRLHFHRFRRLRLAISERRFHLAEVIIEPLPLSVKIDLE